MTNPLLNDNLELSNHINEKQLRQARLLNYSLLAICLMVFVVFCIVFYNDIQQLSIRHSARLANMSRASGDVLMYIFSFYICTFLGMGYVILSIFNKTIKNKTNMYFADLEKDFGLTIEIPILKWIGIFIVSLLLTAVLMHLLLALMFGIVSMVKFLIWYAVGVDLGYDRLQKIEISRYLAVFIVFCIVYWQIKRAFSSLKKEDLE